jgi:pimeloyl-ACP methyl ester carboxylesterase
MVHSVFTLLTPGNLNKMNPLRLISLLTLTGLTAAFFSCSRLDDNLFNANENKITEYKLDSYTGEVDFRLDASYKIPDSLVHLFTLLSQAPGESSPVKIYAVYIGSMQRIATDTVIMYCHGNKDHLDFYWRRAQLLANTKGKNNFGVLMVDYRGYGLSEGSPSEKGLYADVDAALQWLKSKGLTNNRLVMYGFSMGSAPATLLTAEPRSMTPAKLMLEAPFASAEAMVQDASGLALPGAFVTDLKLNNAEEIKKVQQPFFWIHGIDDDFLSMATQGELVYKNYQGTYKVAYRIPKANHESVPNTFGFQNYLQAVGDFITRH